MLTVHILGMFLLNISPSTMYWERKWITNTSLHDLGTAQVSPYLCPKKLLALSPGSFELVASSHCLQGHWVGHLCCYMEFRVLGEPGEGSPPSQQGHRVWFSLSQTHKITASKAHNRDKGWRLKELSACFTGIQKRLCNCKHIKVWVSPAFGGKANPMVDRYSE